MEKKNKILLTAYEENNLIIYFQELSLTDLRPSTLWYVWIMLKKVLKIYNDIDSRKFINLRNFLRNNYRLHQRNNVYFMMSELTLLINSGANEISGKSLFRKEFAKFMKHSLIQFVFTQI